MFMKTSFYSLVAVLLCSAFSPAIAQTPASPFNPPVASTEASAEIDAPATDAVATEPEVAATPAEESPKQSEPVKTSSDSDTKPKYYDDHGNPFTNKYREYAPGGVLLALQRDPVLPNGHFVLFMSAGKPLISCATVKNPKYSTKFDNNTLFVEMEKFIVDERDMPRYAHYECNKTPQEPVARINLSKDQFQENNVKKIKFKVEKATEVFAVKVTDNFIQLTPESRINPASESNRFRPLKVDGVSNPLKFWFYPENTVILTADGASKDVTVESKLMELASAKGLTPLDDLMPEHTHFRKRADSYYFIDKQGRYKISDGELFDYIQTDAMKFGLEADEPIKKNVAVFIRKPGQYE